ncbi:hypothetical protein FEK48_13310 [Escherichia sp. E2593]|nr:hypothetical protein D9738_13380 [Escherichia sp. E10V5]TGC06921.1 hypothetical protein CRG93_18630 [Escherichia sp. E2593]TLI82012.1 hypothetical protein FEK48_13310 [Escherichia sp. E2593]
MTVHPTTEANWTNENVRTEGLLIRDYFAAKAMQGMLSNPGMWDLINEKNAQVVAIDAYLVADAMLKAREGQ